MHYEIAIVGAGMAGLVCAKELYSAGRDVVLIDKSRGLGGRLATRRLSSTQADHGVCYLKPKFPHNQQNRFTAFIQDLVRRDLLTVWSDRLHILSDQNLKLDDQITPRYVAPKGATAIAKDLAKDLAKDSRLQLNQQISDIKPIAQGWQLISQNEDFLLTADIVILAIPAPQALPLVSPIANSEFVDCIANVDFAPCLTAIATYPAPIAEYRTRSTSQNGMHDDWRGVTCIDDELLGWIGLDSTKQINPVQTAMIIQSNAQFAQDQFDTPDLITVGQRLCDRAAKVLDMPWIREPELLQLHRWKYAFAINPIDQLFLSATTTAPLHCIGDWCGGNRLESAFLSGLAIVEQLKVTK